MKKKTCAIIFIFAILIAIALNIFATFFGNISTLSYLQINAVGEISLKDKYKHIENLGNIERFDAQQINQINLDAEALNLSPEVYVFACYYINNGYDYFFNNATEANEQIDAMEAKNTTSITDIYQKKCNEDIYLKAIINYKLSSETSDKDIKNIVIPKYFRFKKVTGIAPGGFICSNIDNVKINGELSYIGAGSFAFSDIKSISIPITVTDVYNGAFSGCYGLETINCRSISSVNIHSDNQIITDLTTKTS